MNADPVPSRWATRIEGEFETVSTIPAEILSRIFQHVVDQPRAAHSLVPFNAGALDLLSISQVSSLFRQVAVSNPTLWALVPYLNGVGIEFLSLMLERSKNLPISLSFSEGFYLPNSGPIWQRILREYNRIASLWIVVEEKQSGFKAKLLLTVPAPGLKHCAIEFRGSRSVPFDFFVEHRIPPFNGCAPQLQSLAFINCHMAPHLYQFPRLQNISLCSSNHVDLSQSSFYRISMDDCLQWRNQAISLRVLTLCNSVSESTDWKALLLLPPLDLPLLEQLTVIGTAEVCRQLASLLRLQSQCSRKATIVYSGQQRSTTRDAVLGAEAAAMFIPTGVRYTECSLSVDGRQPRLSLAKEDGVDTVSFDIRELNFHLTGFIGRIITTPIISFMGFNPPNPCDVFMCWLWESLGLRLNSTLSFLERLHLSFDTAPFSPHVLSGVIGSMTNVTTINASHADAWESSWFLSAGHDSFPRLRCLGIPLDEETTAPVLRGLARFLLHREELESVVFRVSPTWVGALGYAADDVIRRAIAEIATDFPASVKVNWVEGGRESGLL
ncbi:hypothetical protein DFP72DRAFT_1077361 [Ephemerocybe angulata]|uniref:F-box domain-containing protein n=1 Tax=Ephemerocybe angulata TaxID=980116 RepID=A0A8H6HGV7_9AGAR|nr:hypothetical protein DFP72DRAFT_1077361 [Tulosesus angulatus]